MTTRTATAAEVRKSLKADGHTVRIDSDTYDIPIGEPRREPAARPERDFYVVTIPAGRLDLRMQTVRIAVADLPLGRHDVDRHDLVSRGQDRDPRPPCHLHAHVSLSRQYGDLRRTNHAPPSQDDIPLLPYARAWSDVVPGMDRPRGGWLRQERRPARPRCD